MKKLLVASGVIVLLGGFSAVAIDKTYNPQPVQTKVIKTVKTVKIPAVAPTYHIGDTQDGITLIGEYPYSYTDMMAGNGPTPSIDNFLFFAVSGTDTINLIQHSIITTTDGKYFTPDGGPYTTIPACGENACVGFLSNGITIGSFTYNNLTWNL